MNRFEYLILRAMCWFTTPGNGEAEDARMKILTAIWAAEQEMPNMNKNKTWPDDWDYYWLREAK